MNRFKQLRGDELENHLNDYRLTSWSYSKVSSFARNELAFEMEYIYEAARKVSVASAYGQAYHAALEAYFNALKDGEQLLLDDIQQVAAEHISKRKPEDWRTSKMNPTVEKCIEKALTQAATLVGYFWDERAIYEDLIDEVLAVELFCDEWVNVAGKEIPLPCHAIVDLVARDKNGEIILIDHKSKVAFTPAEDVEYTHAKQAITYCLVVESNMSVEVDRVYFVEAKIAKNKDGAGQLLRHEPLVMSASNRILYERMLLWPLKRMIEAISDPDYVYLMNDNDTLCDKQELFNFFKNRHSDELQ